MSEQPEKAPLTPPRVGPLSNISQVAAEMAKVYRASRKGEIEPAEATKFCYMLTALRGALEVVVLEERLTRLEESLAPKAQPVRQFRVVR